MRAIQITEFGGPETLVVRDLPDPTPGEGEVMRVLAAGVNYADTHQTEDSYLAKQTLPMIPGGEVVVETPATADACSACSAPAATRNASPSTRAGCSPSRTASATRTR